MISLWHSVTTEERYDCLDALILHFHAFIGIWFILCFVPVFYLLSLFCLDWRQLQEDKSNIFKLKLLILLSIFIIHTHMYIFIFSGSIEGVMRAPLCWALRINTKKPLQKEERDLWRVEVRLQYQGKQLDFHIKSTPSWAVKDLKEFYINSFKGKRASNFPKR